MCIINGLVILIIEISEKRKENGSNAIRRNERIHRETL